ncbi:MAG TPA: hypothetical protein VF808_09510 [Ktedonobacterales bacterium]
MPLLIAALLGLTATLIVAYPLLGLSRAPREAARANALGEVANQEGQARQALREVELDYTLGNLDSGDYDTLRGRYERRALAALRTRYQREQELDALIERQLDAMRASHSQQDGSADAESVGNVERAPAAAIKPVASRIAPRGVRPVSPRARRGPNRKGGR